MRLLDTHTVNLTKSLFLSLNAIVNFQPNNEIIDFVFGQKSYVDRFGWRLLRVSSSKDRGQCVCPISTTQPEVAKVP